MSLDVRFTPERRGRTSRVLEGVVKAAAFVEPEAKVGRVAATAIRRGPDHDAEQVDQLLFGEGFDILDREAGFAWGQARRDGYVGFVDETALRPKGEAATHRVSAISTFAFTEPNIKSRSLGPYSVNTLIHEERREGRFIKASATGWFVERHLTPIGRFETDPAAVAERFLGVPYLWGGREGLGLDCSGLVQQALLACGRACPRDTSQQIDLGDPVDPLDLERGDLVFWRGHVAMMLDHNRIIHANAHHMAVAIEPLAEALTRIAAAEYGEPTAYRRP